MAAKLLALLLAGLVGGAFYTEIRFPRTKLTVFGERADLLVIGQLRSVKDTSEWECPCSSKIIGVDSNTKLTALRIRESGKVVPYSTEAGDRGAGSPDLRFSVHESDLNSTYDAFFSRKDTMGTTLRDTVDFVVKQDTTTCMRVFCMLFYL